MIVAGCCDVSTDAGEIPSATSCGAFVSPRPVWFTDAGKPAAARSLALNERVLPEMSTRTADAVHCPCSACTGIVIVET